MATLIELARKMRPLIVKAAQSLADEEAVQAPYLYDEWKPGVYYKEGQKLRRGDRVCVVNPGKSHTSQVGWEPENAHSEFRFIDETHAGTLEDPIPYKGNMILFEGLYYSQNGIVYLCTRDSGTPLYHALNALTGTYVEEVK